MKLITAALLSVVLLSGCSLFRGETPDPTGTQWRLKEINGYDVPAEPGATLMIPERGSINGSTGCNTFTGSYRRKDGQIVMGPIATTRKACPPELNDQEQRYLKALNLIRSYKVDGRNLWFYDPSGNEILRFREIRPE